MIWPVTTYRLVSERTEPGLFCGKDELTLGGVPLLAKNGSGFEPRPVDELQQIFHQAYGPTSGIDAQSRLSGLRLIARALDDNDRCRATILGLMLKLPSVDQAGMSRLSGSATTTKADYNDSELRDERGRWTSSGEDKAPSSHWHGRWPDIRRKNPNIVPAQFGVAVPLPPGLLPGIGGFPKPKILPPYFPNTAPSNPANDNATAGAHAAANDNAPKACPDPSYEPSSVARTRQELLYQAQITKLPLGMSVMLNGVDYDGCRDSDQTMLEAKYGGDWFLLVPDIIKSRLKYYKRMMLQAFRQNYNSGGRRVEWHFTNDNLANYWRGEFEAAGYKNIAVKSTSYEEAYNYNLIRTDGIDQYLTEYLSQTDIGGVLSWDFR